MRVPKLSPLPTSTRRCLRQTKEPHDENLRPDCGSTSEEDRARHCAMRVPQRLAGRHCRQCESKAAKKLRLFVPLPLSLLHSSLVAPPNGETIAQPPPEGHRHSNKRDRWQLQATLQGESWQDRFRREQAQPNAVHERVPCQRRPPHGNHSAPKRRSASWQRCPCQAGRWAWLEGMKCQFSPSFDVFCCLQKYGNRT